MDLTIMTRQLSTMVSSGMTILRALYVLEAQTESKPLAEILVKVRKDVEAGLPLSDALERHPKIFSPLFVAMTRAGETGGMLESSLLRIADQLEAEDSLRRQVKSAMMYPAVVLAFAFCVLIGLVAFIVPVFVGVFEQFGGDLPPITKVTVGAVRAASRATGTCMIAIGVGVVYAFRKWKSSERGRGQWDAFRLRIPFKIGDIVQKVALARWSRTLSALVTAGVPLLHALDITAKTAGNRVVENAMDDGHRVASSAAARSPTRSRRRRSSPAWSPTWSASARRPARWTRCSPRSRTSTRTRSTRRSSRSPRSSSRSCSSSSAASSGSS